MGRSGTVGAEIAIGSQGGGDERTSPGWGSPAERTCPPAPFAGPPRTPGSSPGGGNRPARAARRTESRGNGIRRRERSRAVLLRAPVVLIAQDSSKAFSFFPLLLFPSAGGHGARERERLFRKIGQIRTTPCALPQRGLRRVARADDGCGELPHTRRWQPADGAGIASRWKLPILIFSCPAQAGRRFGHETRARR